MRVREKFQGSLARTIYVEKEALSEIFRATRSPQRGSRRGSL